MHAPSREHFEAAYRMPKYLKGTLGKGLMFRKHNHFQVEVYTDTDWVGSVMDSRSTFGYCTFVGRNLVTWSSKKQSAVARSSAEVEFRSFTHGICEALWIKKLLEDLKLLVSLPIKIYCDNKAAISIAQNPILHYQIKHIEVDKYLLKKNLKVN
jgi:hypothetical protein